MNTKKPCKQLNQTLRNIYCQSELPIVLIVAPHGDKAKYEVSTKLIRVVAPAKQSTDSN